MHLLPDVAIQPNLELKTQPKPVLGSLPLAFVLSGKAFDVILSSWKRLNGFSVNVSYFIISFLRKLFNNLKTLRVKNVNFGQCYNKLQP